jgi:hypothetical protein
MLFSACFLVMLGFNLWNPLRGTAEAVWVSLGMFAFAVILGLWMVLAASSEHPRTK